jgi:hypothetical protein
MHEIIPLLDVHGSFLVSLQIVFFISSFQSYLICQSLIGSILSLALFAWVVNVHNEIHVIAATIVGLSLAVITTALLKLPKDKKTFYYVYYYFIQPFILFTLIPIFVIQTKYPVGYPLAFIAWLPINLLIYYDFKPLLKYQYIAIFSLVIFSLLFGFFIYKTIWVSIIIALISQIISTIVAYFIFIN